MTGFLTLSYRDDQDQPTKNVRGLLLIMILTATLVFTLCSTQRSWAAFPGANGKIAFASTRDGNYEIYVMKADGSGQTDLSNNPAGDVEPAWSPDGTKIAFTSNRDGNWEVYVMNADGSAQTNLSNNPWSDVDPAWSPDGRKIAFASDRDGSGEIYVMNADGSGQTNLSNNPAWDGEPAWSPDGIKIAFYRYVGPGDSEIYVMNAGDGLDQVNLSNNPAWDKWADWCPYGTKIAFTSSRGGDPGDVYVMNADGLGQIRLTDSPASDEWPAWSPDGTKIAFASYRDGDNEIYVMNVDGSGQTNLSKNSAWDGEPDWQPVTEVNIDIKPGSYPNAIDPKSKGVIPVALVGSAILDVTNVKIDSLRFGPNEASAVQHAFEDVNVDGFLDLILHFKTQQTGIRAGDTQASLTGTTGHGIPIQGCDSIVTVPG